MHSTDSLFQLNAEWQNAQQLQFPDALEPWLLCQGSLTALLKSHCQTFRLELVAEHWQRLPDYLQQQWQQAVGLKRDVILWCDGKPCVYAQSWLPESTLEQMEPLARLGAQPLGEYIFQHVSLERGVIEVALLESGLVLPVVGEQNELWARRSVFSVQQQPLLVQEIFLPGVLEL
ncbi:4-hydroxybenzoate synthetase (chorismate lyase) [Rheinheimera sp. A13L]|uniref:chorismate--pyruvate lyase family protein n=1 Tax=Rheinheimera sp. A13L TaxID=506534 RepID=UPI000212535A|nr:chorismate lyase [Rheinheimera sp. A13L]EGM76770.1 4-hydroxybenzoate synthetase (chorismate lyase) [Rheinheimera sp. A13L]